MNVTRDRPRLLSAAPSQTAKGRLLAATAAYSGVFLNAHPCSSLGTRLDDCTLRIAVSLRLGTPICAPHDCICGASVDSFGSHVRSCHKAAGRTSRHSSVNDIIKRALAAANVPSRLGPTALTRDDGKCPDCLTLVPWKEGRCLVWDFTCPDTFAVSHLSRAVTGPGTVATEGVTKKSQSIVSCLQRIFSYHSPLKRQQLSVCRRLTSCVKSVDESMQLPTNYALRTSLQRLSVVWLYNAATLPVYLIII